MNHQTTTMKKKDQLGIRIGIGIDMYRVSSFFRCCIRDDDGVTTLEEEKLRQRWGEARKTHWPTTTSRQTHPPPHSQRPASSMGRTFRTDSQVQIFELLIPCS